jgi:hypothetical protein
MSNVSIDIKSLPPADDVGDDDLIILEKPNFTAAAQAGFFKNYLVKEISERISENTYYADEATLTLSAGEFKIKDGGIKEEQLSPGILSRLNGTTSTLSGKISTYIDPITAVGEYLEMFLQPAPGAAPVKYAIRVYKV